MEYEHQQQHNTITALRIQIDECEQQNYASHLQVVGLSDEDEKQDAKRFVKLSKEKLGLKIKESDIEKTTRLGKKKAGKLRPLLVKFKTADTKERIQGERSKLVNHSSRTSNVYLNDRLTKHRQNLLFAARKLVKGRKLFAAWSQGGNILVRKTDSSKILQARDHTDLMEIKLHAEHIMKKPSEDESTLISHLSDYDYSYDSDM